MLSLIEAHGGATISSKCPPAVLPTPVPDRIGPYRIQRLLGEGGMGVVYLAEDSRLGRVVALKAVAPAFVGDATKRERLRREARAAASLNHPGIATGFALEEIDGDLYIAGEYVPGETLRDEIARGPLDPGGRRRRLPRSRVPWRSRMHGGSCIATSNRRMSCARPPAT